MVIVYSILLTAGVTPLLAFLIKRHRYRTVLRHGIKTVAHVIDRRRMSLHGRPPYDIITYAYLPEGASAYQSGLHNFGVGKFNVGDTMDVYYLKDNVARHALTGSKYEGWFLLFCLLFLGMIIYGCFNLHETIGDQTFTFSP